MVKNIDKTVRRLLIECGRCVTLNHNYELRYGCQVWRIRIDRSGHPVDGSQWEHVYNIRRVGY